MVWRRFLPGHRNPSPRSYTYGRQIIIMYVLGLRETGLRLRAKRPVFRLPIHSTLSDKKFETSIRHVYSEKITIYFLVLKIIIFRISQRDRDDREIAWCLFLGISQCFPEVLVKRSNEYVQKQNQKTYLFCSLIATIFTWASWEFLLFPSLFLDLVSNRSPTSVFNIILNSFNSPRHDEIWVWDFRQILFCYPCVFPRTQLVYSIFSDQNIPTSFLPF